MGGTGQDGARQWVPLPVPARCHTNLGTGRAFGAESTAAAVQTAAPASRGVFAGSALPKTLTGPSGLKHRYLPHLFDPLRLRSQAVLGSGQDQVLVALERDAALGRAPCAGPGSRRARSP